LDILIDGQPIEPGEVDVGDVGLVDEGMLVVPDALPGERLL
jgi:hypothetical protein